MCMYSRVCMCINICNGMWHKQGQASKGKQARDAKGKPIAKSIGEPATVVPRNAMEALGGCQVGQELRQKRGLGEPSVGAVVMLCGCMLTIYPTGASCPNVHAADHLYHCYTIYIYTTTCYSSLL